MKTSTLLKINETGFALCLTSFCAFAVAIALVPVLSDGSKLIEAVFYGILVFSFLASIAGVPAYMFAKARLSKN